MHVAHGIIFIKVAMKDQDIVFSPIDAMMVWLKLYLNVNTAITSNSTMEKSIRLIV